MALLADQSADANSNLVGGNGTNAARFTMPGGVAIKVESVVATINNSAGGDATGLLTVADQSGQVIAKKAQGDVVDAGATGTATWALRLTDERPAVTPGTTAWQFAANQSGGDTIPSQAPGFVTKLNMDQAALYTNNATMYTIEPASVGGKYGLAIHETGTYLLSFSVQFFCNGAYDPVLLDLTVSAGEGGSFNYLVPTVLGSFKARGLQDGTQNAWTVTWQDLIVMTAANVATSTTNPIVVSAQQQSGDTADVYLDVSAVQMSTDTFGF